SLAVRPWLARRRKSLFCLLRCVLAEPDTGLPVLSPALLMAAGGTQAAFASQAATTANVTSGIRSAPPPDRYYTMRLSPSSVTVRDGYRTRITVSFRAPADLYGTAVALSVSGLPDGVTASF